MNKTEVGKISGVSTAGLLITLGIVFGDIGTSPLYVIKSILGSTSIIDVDFILGALSCIIWTLTLQTTVKYVIITLRADNRGEGGIFSLFALIRRKAKWAYIFAIIGGSALLADGIITPAISVVAAVEGLTKVYPHVNIIPIVIVIITLLFLVQQFGTNFLGSSFGPIMVVWFSMLTLFGLLQISQYPAIIKAFNPYYAYEFLFKYPGGFILLGSIFLCTTGAEALYSDLGHCGIKNIRITWGFVKAALIINYLGQGAWVLSHGFHTGDNPFFDIMPNFFILPGVIIAAFATVIASQALITGSFSLISEAISLNFWPKMKKTYPTKIKGQVYIAAINWFLYLAVIFVILYFKESSKMDAAYGLSITITMLMTSTLLVFYLNHIKVNRYFILLYIIVYFTIEGAFLIANLHKFPYGGWMSLLLASIFFLIMYGWHNARKVRNSFVTFTKLEDYLNVITDLNKDTSVPKYATNLVYITKANSRTDVESKILYSIFNKRPKRADIYWLLHVDILDDPYTFEYEITEYIPGVLFKIDFRLGFKIEPRVNLYFRQVLDEMEMSNEIDLVSRYQSLRSFGIESEFVFVIIDRVPNYDFEFNLHDKIMMFLYKVARRMGVAEIKAYGLNTSNVLIEKVPLVVDQSYKRKIKRSKSVNLKLSRRTDY